KLPLLPLALFDLSLLASGLALLLSAANVYLRDMAHFVKLALLAWFWVTPIVYPFSQLAKAIGGRAAIALVNPVTPIVLTFERALKFRRVRYEHFTALRDIHLDIEAGTTVGLLGHNGSGKSTLLKCIAGIIQPTAGVVRTAGRMASQLELGAGFHPDLSGRENVYLNGSILGLKRVDVDRVFDDIVGFAEPEEFIDTTVK